VRHRHTGNGLQETNFDPDTRTNVNAVPSVRHCRAWRMVLLARRIVSLEVSTMNWGGIPAFVWFIIVCILVLVLLYLLGIRVNVN
jgi:hypothetical protein